MNARSRVWGVVAAGAAWVGVACGPSEFVGEELSLSQQSQTQDSPRSGGSGGGEGDFCGGFAAIQCQRGFTCVDDPSDDCNPAQGGRDCGGVCRKDTPACGHEPGYTYVSRDRAQCAAILFVCPAGQTTFFNDCGCGCRPQ